MANVGNPSNGQYMYETVCVGIVQVLTRIGLLCCETRRPDESRMLNKMEEKFTTNE